MKIYLLTGSFMDNDGSIDVLISRVFGSKDAALEFLKEQKVAETVYETDLGPNGAALDETAHEQVFSGVYASDATEAISMREGGRVIFSAPGSPFDYFVVEY